MDYISNLEGNIMDNILSRLSTKEAIRTSVLSKVWKYKWGFLRTISVNNLKNKIIDKRIYLESMVNTIQNLTKLEKVRFCCGTGYKSSLIESCMEVIFRKRVNTFELYMLDEEVVLPSNIILACKSLEKVVLALPCLFKAPSQCCFPGLKDLELRHVNISNPSTNTVFIVFPNLERFEIFSCQWSGIKSFGIYAPKLVDFLSEPEGGLCHKYSIQIVQAKIEYITLCGGFIEHIKLNASTVIHAKLLCNSNFVGNTDALVEQGLHTRKLLRECSSINDLEMEGFILEAIAKSKGRLSFPLFEKLEKLNITCDINVEGVLELLHATPNLKTLTLCNTGVWSYYDFDEPVPSCVKYGLEEVIFGEHGATTPQCSLAKFFVENGGVLKTLTFSRYDKRKVIEIIERLSTFAKASSYLDFILDEVSVGKYVTSSILPVKRRIDDI